jgi:hypothetical protein
MAALQAFIVQAVGKLPVWRLRAAALGVIRIAYTGG